MSKCEGCQHTRSSGSDFCYMFETQPETIPCGQHDKYKEVRKITAAMLRKNPFMLHLLATECSEKSTKLTKERIFFDNARYPLNNTIIKETNGD